MPRIARFTAVSLFAIGVLVTLSGIADAQRRTAPRHPPHPPRPAVVHGQVFIGGYFYDPAYGPYPWWQRPGYPYWYFPVYDNRADVRLRVEPEGAEQAAVYVDSFYAGVVDDFNGVFQSLPLTPGGHAIVLYLEGYRTVRHNIYLSPASTFTLRVMMERLPASETSERPELAPSVPAPPAGSYRTPVTPPRTLIPPALDRPAHAIGVGTVDLYVQPAGVEVTIDGLRWLSSEDGHFVVQLPAGRHRVDISKPGYRPFTTEIRVGGSQTVPLNVSLIATTS